MIDGSSLAEADLHGLVDDRLGPDRRADVLRRLSLLPAERARVQAWQMQNDLIRGAFAGIERETIPPALDLARAPHLHDLADLAPLSADNPRSSRARRGAATLATLLLATLSLGGMWLMLTAGGREDGALAPLRGTIDANVASRATKALAVDARTRPVAQPGADEGLPTTVIPDLSQAGFMLSGAESSAGAPAALLFHYRNANADQLVISVARSPGETSTMPTSLGHALSWHRHDKAYALAGTIGTDRLRDIALSLQEEPGQD